MKKIIATATLAAATAGMFAATPAGAAPATHSVVTSVEIGVGANWNRSDRGRKEGWRKNGKAYSGTAYRSRSYNPYNNQNAYNPYNAYNNNGYYGEPVYRSTRVWQGEDNRYYCRRSNGTTGMLIGGAAGALLGRQIAGRRDQTLGTILGAAAGALLGREIDNGGSRCR